MISFSHWYAWLAIGAAASLAGMIWPFRRGIAGAAGNLLLGVAGGILAPLALTFFGVSPDAPLCLGAAAAGALILLVLGHALWLAWIPRAHSQRVRPVARWPGPGPEISSNDRA